MSLEEFKEKSAKAAFGITRIDAWREGICIECRELAIPKCYSNPGKQEYTISGICEECFDNLFKED